MFNDDFSHGGILLTSRKKPTFFLIFKKRLGQIRPFGRQQHFVSFLVDVDSGSVFFGAMVIDLGKTRAAKEGAAANAGNAVGQGDLPQGIALVEGLHIDCFETFRKFDFL